MPGSPSARRSTLVLSGPRLQVLAADSRVRPPPETALMSAIRSGATKPSLLANVPFRTVIRARACGSRKYVSSLRKRSWASAADAIRSSTPATSAPTTADLNLERPARLHHVTVLLHSLSLVRWWSLRYSHAGGRTAYIAGHHGGTACTRSRIPARF